MFFKRKKKTPKVEQAQAAPAADEARPHSAGAAEPLVADSAAPAVEPRAEQPVAAQPAAGETPAQAPKQGFFARIRRGLSRTSQNFTEGLGNLVLGKKEIDEELLEDIETQLLVADIGIEATSEIIDDLTARVARKQLADGDALYRALQQSLQDMLETVEQPLQVDPLKQPFVILVVGVNGVGKTTTIAKLAARLQADGKTVLLGACDTFRAGAVRQLEIWAERLGVELVKGQQGGDPAAVAFDAADAAVRRGVDVLIIDTAGRLHTQDPLMRQLSKISSVMGKKIEGAPHEALLVLDATSGQNAIRQAETFAESVPLTGLVLTKLDGTAKGGVVIAVRDASHLPVKFVGIGERPEDLEAFDPESFVEAMFGDEE